MMLSYSDTKELIELVLAWNAESARQQLHYHLVSTKRSEAEFCESVIEHSRGLNFTADQWFDFFVKVPNLLFAHEKFLRDKLTPQQRRRLFWE
jgi:hypothetical protein